MKKVLLSFLALLILILIGIFGIYWWRQSKADYALISRDSDRLIVVNLDNLVLGLGKNALWNPAAYSSKKDSTEEKDQPMPWQIGIDLPAKMYFFASKADSASYYSIVTIDDLPKLQNYLKSKFSADSLESFDDGHWELLPQKFPIGFVGNDKYVVLWLKPQKNAELLRVRALLSDQFNDLIAVKDHPAFKSMPAESDIVYLSADSRQVVQADFSAGIIDIHGKFDSPNWQLSPNSEVSSPDTSILIDLALNADITPFLQAKRDVLQQWNIPVDSIRPYLGNDWEIKWGRSTVQQTDTVITYDYDDNFEMIEKEEVRQVDVPDLRLAVKASPHLMGFLPDKMFYTFHKRYDDGHIVLGTDTLQSANTPTSKEPLVFRLDYFGGDIAVYLPAALSKLNEIQRISLSGEYVDKSTVGINGGITLKNKKLHPLYYLLF